MNNMRIGEQTFKPLSLYLWSRPDWTTNHRGIASKRGHASKLHQKVPAKEEGNDKKNATECKMRKVVENNTSNCSKKIGAKRNEPEEGKSADAGSSILQSGSCRLQG